MGGKSQHAGKIVELFGEHDLYVEPFGGGGHVLCRKAPSLGEVYNDRDQDLVNFFRVARDQYDELIERLRWVPYSRKQFEMYRLEWKGNTWHKLADVERAAIWFSLLRQAFAASLRSCSWGYSTWRSGRSGGWQPDRLANAIEQDLPAFRDRLRHVQIENVGFEDCIERYQSERALIYADPPYVGTENVYREGGFGVDDHRRLAELLHATPAKVVLSYEDHPLVDELYGGWRRETFETARASQKVKAGGKRKTATEVLLCNW